VYKSFVTLVLLLSYFVGQTQINTLAEDAQISIITIGPGDELYDSFGHNAIRVSDPSNGKDLAFNYGTFDFTTPNFYLKFGRGQLPYALSVRPYKSFLKNYIAEKRWVKEQILDLSYGEKVTIFDYLLNNAQPQNRAYQYDFFFDNCATRIRDVLVANLGDKLAYKDDAYAPRWFTFRQLIRQRLNWNSWGSLGIDIALGAVIDRTATPWEHQFLPDYTFDSLKTATLTKNGKTTALLKQTTTLNEAGSRNKKTNFFLSPFFVFLLIGISIVYITVKDSKVQKRSRWLDGLIFLVTGVVGMLLLVLWLGTDHTATANNYNILWGFPLNLFFCSLIWSSAPKKWLRRYVFFLIITLALLTLHWSTGVQVFAPALLPLLIALFIRYFYLARYLKD
tara:strand:- start:7392 stop:8570 length:1179 start_codon:yes stop_codon:yes gene_type:complete